MTYIDKTNNIFHGVYSGIDIGSKIETWLLDPTTDERELKIKQIKQIKQKKQQKEMMHAEPIIPQFVKKKYVSFLKRFRTSEDYTVSHKINFFLRFMHTYFRKKVYPMKIQGGKVVYALESPTRGPDFYFNDVTQEDYVWIREKMCSGGFFLYLFSGCNDGRFMYLTENVGDTFDEDMIKIANLIDDVVVPSQRFYVNEYKNDLKDLWTNYTIVITKGCDVINNRAKLLKRQRQIGGEEDGEDDDGEEDGEVEGDDDPFTDKGGNVPVVSGVFDLPAGEFPVVENVDKTDESHLKELGGLPNNPPAEVVGRNTDIPQAVPMGVPKGEVQLTLAFKTNKELVTLDTTVKFDETVFALEKVGVNSLNLILIKLNEVRSKRAGSIVVTIPEQHCDPVKHMFEDGLGRSPIELYRYIEELVDNLGDDVTGGGHELNVDGKSSMDFSNNVYESVETVQRKGYYSANILDHF